MGSVQWPISTPFQQVESLPRVFVKEGTSICSKPALSRYVLRNHFLKFDKSVYCSKLDPCLSHIFLSKNCAPVVTGVNSPSPVFCFHWHSLSWPQANVTFEPRVIGMCKQANDESAMRNIISYLPSIETASFMRMITLQNIIRRQLQLGVNGSLA